MGLNWRKKVANQQLIQELEESLKKWPTSIIRRALAEIQRLDLELQWAKKETKKAKDYADELALW